MECPRGSTCIESSHEVKTLAKAVEWCESATNDDLPIRIEQRKSADGRLMVNIYSDTGQLMERRG